MHGELDRSVIPATHAADDLAETPSGGGGSPEQQFVTVMIADQACGIPVLLVRDVLGSQRLTRIPLAPPEVAGSLNLRGRIVTAISLRRRLGLPPLPEPGEEMAVIVEYDRELYALLVDHVSGVASVRTGTLEPNPPNLPRRWATISAGICPQESGLLVVLDVSALLAKAGPGA
ncbi:MAG: chemotaxis protein CheW [Acetobacteraceae bacterium]